MKRISLILVMSVLAVCSFAVNKDNDKSEKPKVETTEATYMLSGTIVDSKTNETVAGATVTIDGKKYYTDLSGNFSIPTTSKGKLKMSVDFISYQSKVVEIDVNSNQSLTVEIQQR